MKPKILIKVVDNGLHGDFILEYPDHETLQRSLENALPVLIEGGVFLAKQLEFPLRIGGVEHQFSAPMVLDKLHFPGHYPVQKCLDECKEAKVEVVSYTLDRKTTHEFLVRRTQLKGATPPMVAMDGIDDEPMAMPPLPKSYRTNPAEPEEKTTDCYGNPIHVGCGGKVIDEKCLKCGHKW